MNALAYDTLPLATTSAFTPRRTATHPQVGGDWARAFAEALQEELPGAEAARGMPAANRATELAHGTAARSPLTGAGMDEARGSAAPGARAAVPPRVQDRGDAVTTTIATPASVDAGEEPGERAPTSARACPAARTGERTPVRIHVEQHAGGLAIWVGCDAQMAPAQLSSLLMAFSTTAIPVASIVCNGAPVYFRSPRFQETP